MSSSGSNSSSSSSSSTVGDGSSIEVTLPAKHHSSKAGDSCTWYADKYCTKPRKCFDCLNVQIDSGQCAINPNGVCVNLSDYEEFQESRNYYVPNYKYYLSTNNTYCSSDDEICADCAAKWMSEYYNSGSVKSSSACVGVSGCVCVAACELPTFTENVIADQCTSKTQSITSKIVTIAAIVIGGGILYFLLARCANRIYRHCVKKYGRPQRRAGVPRAPSGPRMNLDGWKSFHAKLIETERGNLEGEDEKNDDPYTPTVVVEEGEGYRPISPSRMGHHAV